MGTSLQKLEFASPLGSLESYIHWVQQIPLLTLEEEQQLTREYHETGDLEAAKRLVMSHLRYVVSVARGYKGYGLQQGDLIQEGNIGLMKAVKRFDPNVGVRLVTYAMHWIKAEIHEFILKNWRIVKIATTKAQRKLFFNLRKATEKVAGYLKSNDTHRIAEQLKVDVKDVSHMEMSLHAKDAAFDGYSDNEEDNWNSPANTLECTQFDPARAIEAQDWSGQQHDKLHSAFETLDARSQDILQSRWLGENKLTLHDLAAKYNVSAERIRQLEKLAMNKLKDAMQA